MRCKACDTILTDFELTRVDPQGMYYDMCLDCLSVARKAVSDIDAIVDTKVDREYTYPNDELEELGGTYENNLD